MSVDHTCLVPDVLGEIFSFAASPLANSWDDVVQSRSDIALVCPSWRDTLNGQHFVWSFLSVARFTPLAFLKTAIANATRGDLTIHVDATMRYQVPGRKFGARPVRCRSTSDFVSDVVPLLVPCLANTVALLVHTETEEDARHILRVLGSVPMHHVRSAMVQVDVRRSAPSPHPSAAYMLPLVTGLRHLQLWSIFDLYRTTDLYRRLTEVKLANIHLAWPTLQSVLTSTTSLVRLSLHHPDLAPPGPADGRTICLPYLRSLDVHYSTDSVGEIMALLDTPALVTLKVEALQSASIAAFLRTSLPALSRAEHLDISVPEAECDYVCGLLQHFLSAEELGFGRCSWDITRALVKLCSTNSHLRLPKLAKLLLPSGLDTEDAAILLDGRFAADIVVVTSVPNYRTYDELVEWKVIHGRVESKELGFDNGLDIERCGWELYHL